MTALAVRGPVTSGENFMTNSDRVAIDEDKMRVVLLGVRSPNFT